MVIGLPKANVKIIARCRMESVRSEPNGPVSANSEVDSDGIIDCSTHLKNSHAQCYGQASPIAISGITLSSYRFILLTFVV